MGIFKWGKTEVEYEDDDSGDYTLNMTFMVIPGKDSEDTKELPEWD